MERLGLADAPRSGKSLATWSDGGRFITKEALRVNGFHLGFRQTSYPHVAFDIFMKKESG
jgi:hypothetical protein